ncbi:MAG: acyl-CoA thioesterase [Bacteroidia bacterium]|nr:acyl-CoA thioesterase [Bacteroidia bacterium]
MYKDFIHKTPIQIRFKDVDKQGHVNNANHITYLETGRTNFFADVLGRDVDWDETGILLVRTEIDYKDLIFLEDEVCVYTKVTKLGTKSFEMSNYILKMNKGETIECAFGKSTFVCFNYHTRNSIPIPETWREKLVR